MSLEIIAAYGPSFKLIGEYSGRGERTMNTVEALQKMKEHLMVRGWSQGEFEAVDGSVCLMGSITRTGLFGEIFSYDLLSAALYNQIKKTGAGGMFSWNDKPGRTFNEVIDLIDSAIIAEKEVENQ